MSIDAFKALPADRKAIQSSKYLHQSPIEYISQLTRICLMPVCVIFCLWVCALVMIFTIWHDKNDLIRAHCIWL